LSIVTSIQFIFVNADDICYSDYDKTKDEYKKIDEWRIHLNKLYEDTDNKMYGDENIGRHLVNLNAEMKDYKLVGKKLRKYKNILRWVEVFALTIFLLSAILNPNIIYVNENVIACWSLSICY
jgi:hypothetical protein